MSLTQNNKSISTQNTYSEMSDIVLSSHLHTLQQDFVVKARSILTELESRLKQKEINMNIQIKNTEWDTKLDIDLKKETDVVSIQNNEWDDTLLNNICEDILEDLLWIDINTEENYDKHAIIFDNKMNRNSSNKKNGGYLKKTERHPLQKKITNTLRAKKRLPYNQKKERRVFKTKLVEYTSLDQKREMIMDLYDNE